MTVSLWNKINEWVWLSWQPVSQRGVKMHLITCLKKTRRQWKFSQHKVRLLKTVVQSSVDELWRLRPLYWRSIRWSDIFQWRHIWWGWWVKNMLKYFVELQEAVKLGHYYVGSSVPPTLQQYKYTVYLLLAKVTHTAIPYISFTTFWWDHTV